MSFDYDYKMSDIEKYVNITLDGKSFPQKVKAVLQSLVNGSEHVEHIREWIDNFAEDSKQ